LAVAAAAAVTIIAIGLPLWLIGIGDEAVVEPTATAPSPTTPLPGDLGAADEVADLTLAADGNLWGATDAGVVRWDLASGTGRVFTEADGLPGRFVYDIAAAPDGTVWAAGTTWLAAFDGTTWTEVGDNVLPDLPYPFGDLAVGADGTVWISAGLDLIRIDADGATTVRVPPAWGRTEPWSVSLAVDSASTVWASTFMSGVLAYDGEWRHYGADEGLPSNVAGNVAVAADGSVWVGGSGLYGDPAGNIPAGGILQYRDGTWTVHTVGDGVLWNEGNVVPDPAGGVWVVHGELSPALAEESGIETLGGLSYFDGTSWRLYPGADVGSAGVVAGDGTLWMASGSGIVGFDGTNTKRLVLGPGIVPPPAPGDAVTLEWVAGVDPVRLSTVIGEIEFTTWALPGGWKGLWHITETAHGVVGGPYPHEKLVASRDGVAWSELSASVAPSSWVADGDDLVVEGSGRAVRLQWNGETWVELDAAFGTSWWLRVSGPRGTVASSGADVSYSEDGSEFTAASQPPDPALHPQPHAGCPVAGFTSQGRGIQYEIRPVVATDFGFVAIAALSTSFPACEPLVWVSDDGDVWTLTSEESPFGERSFILDMAAIGDRIVAIGGMSEEGTQWVPDEGAVWVSDDGISWQRADVEAGELTTIDGGARGWILMGHLEPQGGPPGEMWFSADGLNWDGPYERPPGLDDRAGLFFSVALLDDRIVGSGKQFATNNAAMDASPARVVVGEFIDD
jgi:hypothetical protein